MSLYNVNTVVNFYKLITITCWKIMVIFFFLVNSIVFTIICSWMQNKYIHILLLHIKTVLSCVKVKTRSGQANQLFTC